MKKGQRPYTEKELEVLAKIERQAAMAANKQFGTYPVIESQKEKWNAKFHRHLESLGVLHGIKQPRTFFERRANGPDHS